MGNFYTNITLRHEDAAMVAEALRVGGRSAFVAPTMHGTVVVFDQGTEGQDPGDLMRLASELSEQLGCAALGVLNHDDDVLRYTLHEPGRAPDAYDSAPGYFDGRDDAPSGGDAKRLRAAFGRGDVDALERLLHGADGPRMAIDRHAALVEVLGLHPAAVGTGYNYIEQGELPDGLESDALLSVAPRGRPESPDRSHPPGAGSPRPGVEEQPQVPNAVVNALERPVRPSAELLAIIGEVAPTAGDYPWTLHTLLAYTTAYVARSRTGRLTGTGAMDAGMVFDERLAALFGVPQATVIELLMLLSRHVAR